MPDNKIIISDTTLTNVDEHCTFKEKIDIITKLDRLGVDIIEMPSIENEKADTLLLHTVAPLVKNAAVFCKAGYTAQKTDLAWNAVKSCKKPGITVALPTSTVQMEFLCHKKAPAILALSEELVKRAKSFGCEVEFKAEDASRSDRDFLISIINKAIASGADYVTVSDSTGNMLNDEASELIGDIYEKCGFDGASAALGAEFSNQSAVSVSNSIAALLHGASYIKTTCVGDSAAPLEFASDVIGKRSDAIGRDASINNTILGRTVSEIKSTAETKKSELSPFDNGVRDKETTSVIITADDSLEKIVSIAKSLGYELSDADCEKVYENAHRLAEKKPIGKRELEAVIATSAMQIPATYTIKSYVINSGNVISATANVELERDGEILRGISAGDGPIDAAFLSIEQIIGQHFELDDFQIRSVTEGREAVGEALVKIRYNGVLYSGRGVSTDIIGASIRAYVKALNKICHEEKL
ncbi:MAG: hypothetical protein IKN38_04435 [Clostridia bacterium]|nr:hypothetical protein [Clostridia bacterium]